MSWIQFESSRVKDAERQAIRDTRERILAEAEERYHKKEAQAERARLRGDDKWMLPSVESKLSDNSSKKKKKKEKKSKKSKKKRRKSSSESSGESSGEEQWVEKSSGSPKNAEKSPESSKNAEKLERDEWMNLSGAFLCAPREKKPKKEEPTPILEKPGQNSRELNPHWKDGGTGMPEDEKTHQSAAKKVMDPNWLKKSLQRAKEQAAEEGRTLEDIAAERWGSLDAIKSMIEEAELNSRPSGSSRRHQDVDRYRRHQRNRSRSRSRSRDRRVRGFEDKPLENRRKPAFRKPGDDGGDLRGFSSRSSGSGKSWRKPEANDRIKALESSNRRPEREKSSGESSEDEIKSKSSAEKSKSSGEKSKSSAEKSRSPQPEEKSSNHQIEIISEDELNKLGAKLIKAEIMGDRELASELKQKLEKARSARKSHPRPSSPIQEDVILTVTNSKGMSRPLEPRSRYEEPQGGRRRDKKIKTHDQGQRVRYFADDDKYSLQDMFQREKGESSSKDDAVFVKMASKSMDMDELFEESITKDQSDAKQDLRDKMRAIKEHKKMEKSLENCRLCFDSKEMLKHLIVAMGSKMYLSLPPHVSLTPGHCILAPIYHVACQTQLDEDVYEELKEFKKSIFKMFRENKEYPVFFEVARGLRRFPHMQLECVPIPEDVGSMAPMYFKKALLECEMEWSTNKKIVDLSKKDVRQSIPKGLPYFMVDFGDHGGFAHVIEDEELFPRNFAQEIIAGMMDLEGSLWRKPRRENFECQRKKVVEFAEKWKRFDFTH